jgi:hypothetical protein
MDTKIHFTLGFKIDNVFFGWSDGLLYQLPYTHEGRYYGLRALRKKINKNGWEYYHVRRKKYSMPKLRAMLQAVDWKVDKPANI